jgi:site-specific DNA recombinase
MTTAIYARQSLDREGSGSAVERQLELCRELVVELQLPEAREFVDNDVSATSGVRPAFTELLKQIRAGRVSDIVVWHTDRLYRRLRDLVEIVDLAEHHHIEIHTVRSGEFDLSTPAGRMIAGMLGHVARYEIEQKSARQVAANLQYAKAGVWQFSIRPYGYKRVKGKVRLVEKEAAVVREAYDRYIAGAPFGDIAADLNARNIPPMIRKLWTGDNMRNVLENPAYAGIRTYKGEVVADGNWTPTIGRETWTEYCAVRARRAIRHDWSTTVHHLLTRIARCGVCGARMVARNAHTRLNANGVRSIRPVYQCVQGACTVRKIDLTDEEIIRRILGRLRQPRVWDNLPPRTDLEPLVQESKELHQRRRDLIKRHGDGLAETTEFRVEAKELADRIEHLEWQISSGASQWVPPEAPAAVSREWWDALTLDQHRGLVSTFMTITIHSQRGGNPFDPKLIVTEWRS